MESRMPKPRLPLTVAVSAILVSLLSYGCAIGQSSVKQPSAGGAPVAKTIDDIRIKIDTTKGEIEATLFASKVPMTVANFVNCLLYTSPSPRDKRQSRMPSSA